MIGIQKVIKEGSHMNSVVIDLPMLTHGELQQRWLSVSAEPIELDGLPHTIVSIDDITRHKLNEQALVESEERIRSIMKNANDPI